MGKFKRKYPKCNNCHKKYLTHEEKESDINIALYILQHAFENRYDKIFLITADSDLLAIIYRLKELFPEKEIVLLIPPGRRNFVKSIKANVNKWYEIKEKHIKKSLLPETILLKNGTTLQRPKEYNPILS